MKWEKDIIPGTGRSETVLKLSMSDIPVLRRAAAQAVKKLEPQYEKLRGIHEMGEATEKQCDKMFALQSELEELNYFLNCSK